MPNPNTPFGFIPTGPIVRVRPYDKDASASVVYMGDVVMNEGDGSIAPASAGNTQLIGAALSFSAGSTADTAVKVADSPDQDFLTTDDGDTTTLAQTHVGSNADHIAGTGNASLMRSAHQIDISRITTVTEGFRLLQIVRNPAYAIGANSILRVNVNEHALKTTTGI